MACACENKPEGDLISADYPEILKVFGEIRESCLAINKIIVPDSEWARFQGFASGELIKAAHKPSVFLALKRGYLSRITSPIHRFLISEGQIRPELVKQYKRDLVEKWMYEPDVIERHHKAKMFMGKLTELQNAEWLEIHRWKILNLEALGGGADIEAESPEGLRCSIEVKYIGIEDSDFRAFVQAVENGTSFNWGSPYTACDFLLSKIYEAGIQLRKSPLHRIVCIGIAAEGLHGFIMPLQNNWINWKSPSFFKNEDFKEFFGRLILKYPQIEETLVEVVNSINEKWILSKWNDPARKSFEFIDKIL